MGKYLSAFINTGHTMSAATTIIRMYGMQNMLFLIKSPENSAQITDMRKRMSIAPISIIP